MCQRLRVEQAETLAKLEIAQHEVQQLEADLRDLRAIEADAAAAAQVTAHDGERVATLEARVRELEGLLFESSNALADVLADQAQREKQQQQQQQQQQAAQTLASAAPSAAPPAAPVSLRGTSVGGGSEMSVEEIAVLLRHDNVCLEDENTALRRMVDALVEDKLAARETVQHLMRQLGEVQAQMQLERDDREAIVAARSADYEHLYGTIVLQKQDELDAAAAKLRLLESTVADLQRHIVAKGANRPSSLRSWPSDTSPPNKNGGLGITPRYHERPEVGEALASVPRAHHSSAAASHHKRRWVSHARRGGGGIVHVPER
jgi:hypothetical protein